MIIKRFMIFILLYLFIPISLSGMEESGEQHPSEDQKQVASSAETAEAEIGWQSTTELTKEQIEQKLKQEAQGIARDTAIESEDESDISGSSVLFLVDSESSEDSFSNPNQSIEIPNKEDDSQSRTQRQQSTPPGLDSPNTLPTITIGDDGSEEEDDGDARQSTRAVLYLPPTYSKKTISIGRNNSKNKGNPEAGEEDEEEIFEEEDDDEDDNTDDEEEQNPIKRSPRTVLKQREGPKQSTSPRKRVFFVDEEEEVKKIKAFLEHYTDKCQDFNIGNKLKSFCKGAFKGFLGGVELSVGFIALHKLLTKNSNQKLWLFMSTLYATTATYFAYASKFFMFSPDYSNKYRKKQYDTLDEKLKSLQQPLSNEDLVSRTLNSMPEDTDDNKRKKDDCTFTYNSINQKLNNLENKKKKLRSGIIIKKDKLLWERRGYWLSLLGTTALGGSMLYYYLTKK